MKIAQGKENLTSTGGNVVAGHVFCAADAKRHLKEFQKRRPDAISDYDILATMIGLICNGRTDFCDVDLYRDDKVFATSFGITRLPSESSLRNRFDEFPTSCEDALRNFNVALIKRVALGTVDVGGLKLVPVDVDVSCLDNSGSHKERCGFTYKKTDGFSPIFAYIGTEGYMLDAQLRPGKQHCQKDTPEFLGQLRARVEHLGFRGRVLYRLDSGNDARETIGAFGQDYFIVKRNLRKESLEQWLDVAVAVGELEVPREGKKVYFGTVDHKIPGGGDDQPACPVAFRVTVRTTDSDGNGFVIPQIEVETYWFNLPCSARTVVELYHAHGTSEQFHSELKSDLDVERLPSGKYCVNRLVLLCGMVAFNVLRAVGQGIIARAHMVGQKIDVARWRLKTVLQNVIYCSARLVRHAGQEVLRFGRSCPWFAAIDDMLKT